MENAFGRLRLGFKVTSSCLQDYIHTLGFKNFLRRPRHPPNNYNDRQATPQVTEASVFGKCGPSA